MNQRNLLSRIQAYSEDILKRENSMVYDTNYGVFLVGAVREAESVYDKSYHAQKAIKNDEYRMANRFYGEFGIATKNFADNLNRFLQVFYGGKSIVDGKKEKLGALSEKIVDAPCLLNGKNIYDEFTKVHKYQDGNTLVDIRNFSGHGKSHVILDKDKKFKCGYAIKIDGHYEEPLNFLDENSYKYLQFGANLVESIAKVEKQRLDGNCGVNNFNFATKNLGNIISRYQKATKTLIGSTCLGIGFAGSMFVQPYMNLDFNKTVLESTNVLYKNLYEAQVNLSNTFCYSAFGKTVEEFMGLPESEQTALMLRNEELNDSISSQNSFDKTIGIRNLNIEEVKEKFENVFNHPVYLINTIGKE